MELTVTTLISALVGIALGNVVVYIFATKAPRAYGKTIDWAMQIIDKLVK